ncbi:MAG: peptidoglycan DD-metalloendopeptidase family protein [Eubacterium sp.]|nr:peptidoglycan DD-metalloendopeptidase family protein [Eubacterium sp.]MCM1213429.1 peptidoglycan DD-metalloendopeptidase family protein [Lachnospiraceae bacterium]MCM1305075.1 peptidoglycan DD-metalloendopeptidase family protein [Butyrivibrio sp.]MCM1343487.1 peptidoglycan DD-metalloendopeptidase family protein [Muribaculaceae bacterium]MCM1240706.1 peptidoglycan DD-metalloendopeptidase family protein [Lachnospiraceae bacterium]
MGRKRHKRKKNHVVLVTSDAVDAKLKQFRFRPWILQTVIVVFCVLCGAAIGYVFYETDDRLQQTTRSASEIEQLELQNQELTDRNAELESLLAAQGEKIQILSDTVNQKVESETALLQQLESLTTPVELPLTGRATMEEVTEGNPMCIFTGASGTMAVATANGTVIAVNDDVEYGHNIWVDHGNGYITIYRNQGDAMVKQGETVKQGATLFLIGEDNNKLGYQMMRDNEYIDPMEMLILNG